MNPQLEVEFLPLPTEMPNQDGKLRPIGAVVAEVAREYPDVTHSSIRFLEREGLLTTTRTAGGHRLFSAADVERLRQIKAWQAQRLSLEEIRRRLAALDALPPPDDLARVFLARALAGEMVSASQAILAADEVGMPLARLFGEVLQPALTELGRRWAEGELLVAQEKEVSELTRDLVAELSRRHARPRADGPILVAACVEGERHELGLRMVCGLCRAAGYAVHYLGADVAPRFLLEAVRLHRPAVVLLSAKLALNLPAVKDALAVLASGLAPQALPAVVVGGSAAVAEPETIRQWGAAPVTERHPVAALEAVAMVLAAAALSHQSATEPSTCQREG